MLSRFVLLLLASSVLRADSIVLYSQTVNLSQQCGIALLTPCSSLQFSVPQSTQTLQGITFTFADTQRVFGGYNDMGIPIGTAIALAWTAGVDSALPGFPLEHSWSLSTFSSDSFQVGGGHYLFADTLSASDSLDETLLEGIGLYTLTFTPFGSGSFIQGGPASVTGFSDNATLTIYADPVETPEPRCLWIVPLLAISFRPLRSRWARHSGRAGSGAQWQRYGRISSAGLASGGWLPAVRLSPYDLRRPADTPNRFPNRASRRQIFAD